MVSASGRCRPGPQPPLRGPKVPSCAVLLFLAILLGVVTMHATMAPDPQGSTTAAMTDKAMAGAVETPGVEHPPDPMPASHELLHLCLAVLAAAIALGLAAIAVTILTRRGERSADPCPHEVVLVRPRPPHAPRSGSLRN